MRRVRLVLLVAVLSVIVLPPVRSEGRGGAARGISLEALATAPRLSMLDGQAASITVTDQVAYVAGLRRVRRGDIDVADPLVDVVLDGMVMRLTGRLGAERKTVDLDVRATWAEVPRPRPVFSGRVGKASAPVRIQVPHADMAQVQSTVRAPLGGHVLLAGPARPGGDVSFLVVHVTSRDVSPKFLQELARPPEP